jgi:5-methyltetrahydrofolate--homocysteine methyltransferase
MKIIEQLISTQKTTILDGAMGTMLMNAGLSSGACPEIWNVEEPEKVRAVHDAYIAAGSQMVLTNTFGGTRFRLERHGLADRVYELNKAAAELLRAAVDAAPTPVIAAGSIGPTGVMMKPMGLLTFEAAKEAFKVQTHALADGGVDLIWIETLSDLTEVKAAIEAAQEVTDLPVAATMTFDTKGRTMMGVKPEQMISELANYDLVAIGANCGNGPDEIEEVISKMRAATPTMPLIAKANAGMPKIENGEVVFDGTPEVMAEYALRVKECGANLIGGCCGNNPAHIAAISTTLA